MEDLINEMKRNQRSTSDLNKIRFGSFVKHPVMMSEMWWGRGDENRIGYTHVPSKKVLYMYVTSNS
jgi:hypothetical protein